MWRSLVPQQQRIAVYELATLRHDLLVWSDVGNRGGNNRHTRPALSGNGLRYGHAAPFPRLPLVPKVIGLALTAGRLPASALMKLDVTGLIIRRPARRPSLVTRFGTTGATAANRVMFRASGSRATARQLLATGGDAESRDLA